MTTTSTLRDVLVRIRGVAADIAYGINAGAAIRHGQQPPPPPRPARPARCRTRA